MSMIARLSAFVTRNVEGYLFADLETLKAASPPPGQSDGAVGYPLIMTAFSGVELLGNLVSSSSFDATRGADRFDEFWRSHLYPNDAARQAAGTVLYKVARHGLAHAFVVKGNLEIVKSSPTMHLVRTPTGAVSVDAVQLAVDLRHAYDTQIKPAVLAGSSLASTMATRLSEMESAYAAQSTPLLSGLALPAAPVAPATLTATHLGLMTSPGATGPAFPITYKSTP